MSKPVIRDGRYRLVDHLKPTDIKCGLRPSPDHIWVGQINGVWILKKSLAEISIRAGFEDAVLPFRSMVTQTEIDTFPIQRQEAQYYASVYRCDQTVGGIFGLLRVEGGAGGDDEGDGEGTCSGCVC